MKKTIAKDRKLIVILGPTASGKSALGVQLALWLSSRQAKKKLGIQGIEIISADSRQVYKGLDIGSGKITKKEMKGVPHHFLSVASSQRRFTVAQYQRLSTKAIASVLRRRKLPILVGGSPLYIYSVVDGWSIPEVKPNLLLRKELEKLPIEKLFLKLKKLDPRRAKMLQESSGQSKNKRRLIRALEIVLSTGKPVSPLKKHSVSTPWDNNAVTILGTHKDTRHLNVRIKKRFLQMLKRGFLNEIKKLRKQGLSWNRIESFGLEYREGAQYLQGKISRKEMIEKAIKATEDFSRRQMTWFKKDSRIHWIRSYTDIERLTHKFLRKNA